MTHESSQPLPVSAVLLFGYEDKSIQSQKTGLLIQTHPIRFSHSHTRAHLLPFARRVCRPGQKQLSCCSLVLLMWVAVSVLSVCVCVCGPCYTDEPLPLLDPGRVHAYFHSWWTISGLKWLWSGAGHFRGVPACFSALTAAVTVQAAPNFLTAARFLFAMGKVAVKSSMCLF